MYKNIENFKSHILNKEVKKEEFRNKEAWIFLNNLKSVNNRHIKTIEETFDEEVEYIFRASNKEINNLRISEKARKEIIDNRREEFLIEILKDLDKKEVNITTLIDEEYPENLKNIPDRPRVLYYRGSLKEDDSYSISVVGPRKPSNYGIYVVQKLVDELSKYGIKIISGMASGIDTHAHMVALRNKVRTIAVLGTGVDIIYPSHNRNIYKKIIERGAVVSEFPLGTKGLPYNFPKRNRIISGYSLGTLIIEAEERSGTLITCNHALEQGREVFSVPGNINSMSSKGTNSIIKQGAKLVDCIDDILEEIVDFKDIKKDYKDIEYDIDFDKEENQIIETLRKNPKTIDELSEQTEINIIELNSLLTILELKGKVNKLNDGKFSL